MLRLSWLLVPLLALSCTSAPSARKPAQPPAPAGALTGPPWATKKGASHPLVGVIWATATGERLGEAELVKRLSAARFVLLGEKHDNPDHHRLQAGLVGELARLGRKPAVVFEMIEAEQQPEVDAFVASKPPNGGGLGDAVAWKKRGWPAWSMYQPIADVALGAGLRLVAGNLSAAEARAVARAGLHVLGPERIEGWGLKVSLGEKQQKSLEAEMRDSHCGHLPERMLPTMADAQRARDAAMADRLLASGPAGAVLIAGAGHARSDRGVPFYLRARGAKEPAVTVRLAEVRDGADAPEAYGDDGKPPFDFVWFTPRVDDDDPCERFRKPADKTASVWP